jgi:hypothetical protein
LFARRPLKQQWALNIGEIKGNAPNRATLAIPAR